MEDAVNVPEKTNGHKYATNQPTGSKSPENASTQFDKMHVSHPPRGKFVRLSHRFIRQWGRVLHPLTFMVFCVLEMWADFEEVRKVPNPTARNGVYVAPKLYEPNPGFGHTDGYHSVADLAKLAGRGNTAVRRALAELAKYGLLRHAEPDPL